MRITEYQMNIDWINSILVSVSMSVDCMTVGAMDGIRYPKLRKRRIFLLSFFFGFFQYLMPTLGYFVFYLIMKFSLNDLIIEKLDTFIPWIAFALLALLGIKNIIEWIKERKEKEKDEEIVIASSIPFKDIILQSIATSIDALCIGFVYSPLQYSALESQIVFLLIGGITFLLSSITTLTGKKIGRYLVKWAGLIAGIVFIGIGLKILLESFF